MPKKSLKSHQERKSQTEAGQPGAITKAIGLKGKLYQMLAGLDHTAQEVTINTHDMSGPAINTNPPAVMPSLRKQQELPGRNCSSQPYVPWLVQLNGSCAYRPFF